MKMAQRFIPGECGIALKLMMPYFASSGHDKYTKATAKYIADFSNLCAFQILAQTAFCHKSQFPTNNKTNLIQV